MSESGYSPLARLVLAMVCLSVAGTCVAGAHYYAVDLPEQNNLQAPLNAKVYCMWPCEYMLDDCKSHCDSFWYCQKKCEGLYAECKATC